MKSPRYCAKFDGRAFLYSSTLLSPTCVLQCQVYTNAPDLSSFFVGRPLEWWFEVTATENCMGNCPWVATGTVRYGNTHEDRDEQSFFYVTGDTPTVCGCDKTDTGWAYCRLIGHREVAGGGLYRRNEKYIRFDRVESCPPCPGLGYFYMGWIAQVSSSAFFAAPFLAQPRCHDCNYPILISSSDMSSRETRAQFCFFELGSETPTQVRALPINEDLHLVALQNDGGFATRESSMQSVFLLEGAKWAIDILVSKFSTTIHPFPNVPSWRCCRCRTFQLRVLLHSGKRQSHSRIG